MGRRASRQIECTSELTHYPSESRKVDGPTLDEFSSQEKFYMELDRIKQIAGTRLLQEMLNGNPHKPLTYLSIYQTLGMHPSRGNTGWSNVSFLGGTRETLVQDVEESNLLYRRWGPGEIQDQPDYRETKVTHTHASSAQYWLYLKRARLYYSFGSQRSESTSPALLFKDDVWTGPEDLLAYGKLSEPGKQTETNDGLLAHLLVDSTSLNAAMLAEVTQYFKLMPVNPGQAASTGPVPDPSPSFSQDAEKVKNVQSASDTAAKEVLIDFHEKNDEGKTAEIWGPTTTCGITLTVCGFLLGMIGRIAPILIVFFVGLKSYLACVSWLESIRHKQVFGWF